MDLGLELESLSFQSGFSTSQLLTFNPAINYHTILEVGRELQVSKGCEDAEPSTGGLLGTFLKSAIISYMPFDPVILLKMVIKHSEV